MTEDRHDDTPATPLTASDEGRTGDAGTPGGAPAEPHREGEPPIATPDTEATPEGLAPTAVPAPVGWAAYAPRPEPGPRYAIGPDRGRIPSVRSVVASTLELLRAADPDLRAGSIHVVRLVVLLGLPIVLLSWSLLVVHGDALLQGGAVRVLDDAEAAAILAVAAIGLLGLVAVAIESQLVAALLLAPRLMRHTLGLAAAVELSRRRFWPLLRANAAVFIFSTVPATALSTALTEPLGQQRLLVAQTIQLAIGFVLGAPFTYTAVACAVGGYGAVTAIRASFRLAARRWRVAFLVAILSTLAQLLVELAASSGLDLVGGLLQAAHPNAPTGAAGALLALGVALVLLVVAGAVLFALAVAGVAPQLAAFADLAGLPTEGPDADLALGVGPRVRLISRPMLAGVAVAFLAALPETWAAVDALLRH